MEKNNSRVEKNGRKKLVKRHWIIICAVCAAAAVLIICLAVFGSGEEGNDQVYQDLKEEAVSETVPESTPAPTPQPTMPISKQTVEKTVRSEVVPSDRYIDFTVLEERNPDIIGWISVDGTEIDYPLLKSADNTEYLNNDIDGEENVNGAIFMDMANKTNYTDRNTVIYGHNMKNGSMFAGLHEFEDKDFFDENRFIKIYTRDGMRKYEIVAAYLTDDRNVLYENDFTNDEVWSQYIEEMLGNDDEDANIKPADIGEDDKIVTLSTCKRGEGDRRYLVVGVLQQHEE